MDYDFNFLSLRGKQQILIKCPGCFARRDVSHSMSPPSLAPISCSTDVRDFCFGELSNKNFKLINFKISKTNSSCPPPSRF